MEGLRLSRQVYQIDDKEMEVSTTIIFSIMQDRDIYYRLF